MSNVQGFLKCFLSFFLLLLPCLFLFPQHAFASWALPGLRSVCLVWYLELSNFDEVLQWGQIKRIIQDSAVLRQCVCVCVFSWISFFVFFIRPFLSINMGRRGERHIFFKGSLILSSVDVWGLPSCMYPPWVASPTQREQTGSKNWSHHQRCHHTRLTAQAASTHVIGASPTTCVAPPLLSSILVFLSILSIFLSSLAPPISLPWWPIQ